MVVLWWKASRNAFYYISEKGGVGELVIPRKKRGYWDSPTPGFGG